MPKIESIYAYVAEATPGNEGVPSGYDVQRAREMPLLGSDWARISSVRGMAQEISQKAGKPLALCRFSLREEIEVISPLLLGALPWLDEPAPSTVVADLLAALEDLVSAVAGGRLASIGALHNTYESQVGTEQIDRARATIARAKGA